MFLGVGIQPQDAGGGGERRRRVDAEPGQPLNITLSCPYRASFMQPR
jgi:hypothetical protein